MAENQPAVRAGAKRNEFMHRCTKLFIEAVSSFRECGLSCGLRDSLCTLQLCRSVVRLITSSHSFPKQLQHSVWVDGQSLPRGDLHPSRSAKLRLAHQRQSSGTPRLTRRASLSKTPHITKSRSDTRPQSGIACSTCYIAIYKSCGSELKFLSMSLAIRMHR